MSKSGVSSICMQHEPVLKLAREDYDMKMRGMLNTTIHKRLKKDPTPTQESRLSQKNGNRWEDLEEEGGFVPSTLAANHLGSTASQRSTKTTYHSDPLYPASGPFLISYPSISQACLISPQTGKTGSCVKNSRLVVQVMTDLRIGRQRQRQSADQL